ncbi:MAG: hypothetical protein JST80_13320 [Bdellovibrionales bacterium]|nr:hypothetical protein [Bdellovibrionales bacterium]
MKLHAHLILSLLLLSTPVLADQTDAARLRAAIAVKPTPFELAFFQAPTTSIELPVSRGFAQLGTQLCWTYAFFNALETRYMVNHPSDKLELSRGVMQYLTMQDRFLRKIQHGEDYLSERGDVVDAYNLIVKSGLYAYDDYKDIFSNGEQYYPRVKKAVFAQTVQAEQEKTLTAEILKIYPVLPERATFLRGKIDPKEMAASVLNSEQWMEYAAIDGDHAAGWADHPDPDARSESQAYFISKDLMMAKITESLKKGIPVTFANTGHVVLIYGAKFDAKGDATEFMIKDSYPGYFYTASAASVRNQMMAIGTTLVP